MLQPPVVKKQTGVRNGDMVKAKQGVQQMGGKFPPPPPQDAKIQSKMCFLEFSQHHSWPQEFSAQFSFCFFKVHNFNLNENDYVFMVELWLKHDDMYGRFYTPTQIHGP